MDLWMDVLTLRPIEMCMYDYLFIVCYVRIRINIDIKCEMVKFWLHKSYSYPAAQIFFHNNILVCD